MVPGNMAENQTRVGFYMPGGGPPRRALAVHTPPLSSWGPEGPAWPRTQPSGPEPLLGPPSPSRDEEQGLNFFWGGTCMAGKEWGSNLRGRVEEQTGSCDKRLEPSLLLPSYSHRAGPRAPNSGDQATVHPRGSRQQAAEDQETQSETTTWPWLVWLSG